jgi:hypothetical protein
MQNSFTLDDLLSIVNTALLGFMAAVGKLLLGPPTALTKLLLKDHAESLNPCRDLMLQPRSLDDWIGFIFPRSEKRLVENDPRVRPEEKLHVFNPSPIKNNRKHIQASLQIYIPFSSQHAFIVDKNKCLCLFYFIHLSLNSSGRNYS